MHIIDLAGKAMRALQTKGLAGERHETPSTVGTRSLQDLKAGELNAIKTTWGYKL